MASRWSIRRRTAPSRSQLPRWQQLKSAESPDMPAAGPQQQIRTEVVVNEGSGSRRPKTVITIHRSYKPASPVAVPLPAVAPVMPASLSSTPCSSASSSSLPSRWQTPVKSPSPKRPLQPAFEPRVPATKIGGAQEPRPQLHTLHTPLHESPKSHKPHGSAHGSARESVQDSINTSHSMETELESFGIDVPGSPSSTLHDLASSRYLDADLLTSPSSYSNYSAATAVDDGLSPWGLPKAMEDGEEVCEAVKPSLMDYDGDFASIDFGSVYAAEAPAKRPVDSARTDLALLAHRKRVLLALAYGMELVVKHRASVQHQQEQKLVHARSHAQPRSLSQNWHFSPFGSWI